MKITIIIPLFVHQCHEQEIPEVIPIEGVPFLNQIKSTQLNTTQIKSNNQMLVFEERGKPEYPEKNLSEQSREPTNSAHFWRRVRESNPGHIGGRRVLWHCANPAPPSDLHVTDTCLLHRRRLSLLVLFLAPRGFSPVTPVFPSPQKPTFDLFDLICVVLCWVDLICFDLKMGYPR